MLSGPQTSLRHDADVHSFLSTLRSYPHKRCCRGHRRLSDTMMMSSHPLIPLRSIASSGPQPCRRYGCAGCAGGTAVVGNTRLNLSEVKPGEIQHIRCELRRCSVVIADAVGVVIERFQVSNSKFLFLISRPTLSRGSRCWGELRSLR